MKKTSLLVRLCCLFALFIGISAAHAEHREREAYVPEPKKVTIIQKKKGDDKHTVVIKQESTKSDNEKPSVTVKQTTTTRTQKTGIIRRILNFGF